MKQEKVKLKLTRKVATLSLENDKCYLVNAWVYNDLLAWHKAITNQWVLTHLSTGYKVIDFYGKYGDIRPITQEIAKLDWKTNNHEYLRVLSIQVKNIVRKYE